MAAEQFSNNATTTLNGAITSGATSLVVTSATGFPTVPQFRLQIDSELLLVTAVSGTTFTVTRGVENTTAASHASGAAVTTVLTAGALGGTSDAAAATPSLRSLGTGATQACAGNDSRLSAVTSVATAGLATGGPITSTGTVTVTAATQSDQETATSTSTCVTPGRQHYHPSAAKGWVNFKGTGTVTINASYNVTSITDVQTGGFTVNWSNSFSSANYAVVGFCSDDNTSSRYVDGRSSSPLASGSAKVNCIAGTNGTWTDPDVMIVIAFGDQLCLSSFGRIRTARYG